MVATEKIVRMNLRIDKVVRSTGFGFRKVYSLVLDDAGLYLIHTGSTGALKRFRFDRDLDRAVADANPDRSVAELQANEARIGPARLGDLLSERDNYFVRLEAIEDVVVWPGPPPRMQIKVSGSDHRLAFPLTPLEQVEGLQRALNKWNLKR